MSLNKSSEYAQAQLDAYYVCEQVNGAYKVKRVGILDEDIQEVYSDYQELPDFIKRALAVINMAAQAGGSLRGFVRVAGVGAILTSGIYIVYPQQTGEQQ